MRHDGRLIMRSFPRTAFWGTAVNYARDDLWHADDVSNRNLYGFRNGDLWPYHRFTLRPTSAAELNNHLYFQIFITAGFIISIPAIILQLILIPLLMEAL